MANPFRNRVRETSAAPGTGAFTLAQVTAYQRFASKFSVGFAGIPYVAEDAAGNWERGRGTYSATNTLSRTAIFESSNSGAAVNFTGATTVTLTIPAPGVDAQTTADWLEALGVTSSADLRVLAAHFAVVDSGAVVRGGKAGDSTLPNNQPFGFASNFYSLRKWVETDLSQNGGKLSDFIVGSATWSMTSYKALSPAPTVGIYCFGENDACQTVVATDANKIAFASTLRTNFLTLVTGIRASFPNLPMVIMQPNHLASGSTAPQVSNTVQMVNDALDLAFRGSVALGVPSLQSVLPAGVIVLDVNGQVFNVGISATGAPLIDTTDRTHPQSPVGFETRANALAALLASEFNPTRSATIEAGAAQGQATISKTVLEGGDYKLAYTGIVTVNNSSGWNVSVGSQALTDQAMGGAFGQSPGQANPRGLVPGDIAIWDDDTVDLILVGPTGQQSSDLRWDPFSGGPGDWCRRVFGSGTPPYAVGRTFRIFRHIYANSPGARNQFRLRNGTPAERSLVPPRAYRFWLVDAQNGSCVIQGIGGETDATNGQTANGHTLLTTDRLFIGGVTLNTGLLLTGATITTGSNNTINITLAGTDFRGSGNGQGFIFSST